MWTDLILLVQDPIANRGCVSPEEPQCFGDRPGISFDADLAATSCQIVQRAGKGEAQHHRPQTSRPPTTAA